MKVWDGLCSGRRDLHATTAPKHAEYVAIVREIQGIQEFINSVTQGDGSEPAPAPTLLDQVKDMSPEDRAALKVLLFRS